MENVPGETETWIVNDGLITDPDGRDITGTFRADGPDAWAKLGPLHFDFKAPVRTNDSEVVIAASDDASTWVSTEETYYPDGGSAAAGGGTRRFRITEMSDMGVGHVYGMTSAIAVGDCGVGANADTRGATAFVPLDGEGFGNITLINQLPEEDPAKDGVADGGGVDCYVAEVQSLTDRLGNAVGLGNVPRIRTKTTFGVDRTAPVISRKRPSESIVLSDNSLHFEVEEPRLETGEDGSRLTGTVTAWAGSSNRRSGRVYWSGTAMASSGSVTIDITPDEGSTFAREQSHTVYAATADAAGNETTTTFTFVRDQTAPALSLSAVPSSFGATSAKSVSVAVAGTLTDATEIRRAFLSIHHADDAGACTADDPLPATQVGGPVRRLDNGTNSIEFSEVFTVKQGADLGTTTYCFYLTAEDDARDADDRDAANAYETDGDVVATFSVGWPGTAAPPGPTFEFFTPPTGAATALVAADSLGVGEGATSGNVYWVKLKDAPSDATYPLAMTIDASATVTTTIGAGANRDGMFGSATDSVSVTVGTAHDRNIVSELRALTHMAKDFDDTDFPVRVMDDDFMISTDVSSIREDDDAVKVLVTVTAGSAQAADNALSVTIGAPNAGPAVAADIASGSASTASVTIAEDEMSDTVTVEIDAADDGEQNEPNDFIELSVSGSDPNSVYYAPAEIMIIDDDPDIELSLSVTEVDEDAGAVPVTITATSPVSLTIDAGGTVATATTTVTIADDTEDDDGETIEFSAINVTVGSKAYTFKSVKLKIVDNDDS